MNRRQILLAAAAAVATLPMMSEVGRAQGASHATFDELLGRYVRPQPDGVNRVDYAAWHKSADDRRKLDGYIADLARGTPSKLPRGEAFAYWANLYNAITLKVILDRYPVKSIREIRSDGFFDPKAYIGPWRTKRVTVEGKQLSLDDIEHDIMRPTFKDPRVHYSVNCASFGCPNLPARAWSAATLEKDLEEAARAFVNHPRGVAAIEPKKLKVSSIYKWFRDDFGGTDAGVIAHLRKYSRPELAAVLDGGAAIAQDDYDWSLNGLPTGTAMR